MFRRVLIGCCLFVLSGCIYNDEPMPKIAHDYNSKAVQSRLLRSIGTGTDADGNIPRNWLPPSQVEKKWLAIVIHHSGTKNGNAAIFGKWHKKGKYWEGVGYNFVIGNGTDSGDGQIEVTYRWRKQIAGAHCGGTRGNWANRYAIGICLVGNFNHTIPTMQQMWSLAKLVRFLQNRYEIPKSRVYSHNTTPGARVTDCPGKNFSAARLKSMLEF